jgi:hypothetical protein
VKNGEIMARLRYYTGKFPKAALDAAIERKDDITPSLLVVLQQSVDDMQSTKEDAKRMGLRSEGLDLERLSIAGSIEAHRLGECFPDLILYDSLYFSAATFQKVRQKSAHIPNKSSNLDFRFVLQDAKFLFEHEAPCTYEKAPWCVYLHSAASVKMVVLRCTHNVVSEVEEDGGYDAVRLCHWRMRKATGEFACYRQKSHISSVEAVIAQLRNFRTGCTD